MSEQRPVILHVDDDEANRYAVTRSLLKAGYDVIEAGSGAEALRKANENPELIILDVRLPDINGFEVCRRLKADPGTADIPVLHLSASFISSQDKAQGLDGGADAYLVRPVEPVELVATVRSLLRARRSEAALRESEERYRLLVENIKDYAIFMTDVDGVITSWNTGAEHLLGYTEDEALSMPFERLFTPEDRAVGVPANELRTARDRGRAIDRRWHVRKNGERFFVDGVLTSVRDDAGRPIGFSKLMQDVTAQFRSEMAMRLSEERFRTAFAGSAVGMAITDAAGGFVQVNDAFCRITGYSHEQLAQLDFAQITHPDDRERYEQLLGELLRKERGSFVLEKRYVRPDGSTVWVQNSKSATHDEQGAIVNIIVLSEDITERKRSDELLKSQNRTLELIAADAPLSEALAALTRVIEEQADGRVVASILLLDEDGKRFRVGAAPNLPASYNEAVQRIDIAAGIGTCMDAAARNRTVMTSDIATDPAWAGIKHLPLALGLRACWSMPIRSSRGMVIGTFAIYLREAREPAQRERELVESLSRAASLAIERRNAEAEREGLLERERSARAEAERASRMKDEFLATLSHELRTPLNAIMGWSTILRMPNVSDDDLQQGIETIERNARSQAQIIEDLLDMSRIISGKVRLDVQRVDLPAILQAGVETVTPTADAKGVRLQTVIDPIVGPVSGDPNRLQQVMWNLLTNAIKFTPRGGRVQVLLERVNSHLEISVVDTGEGISPEFLPHVFDRFRQADASTTRQHGGLGLGLAIAKQLVDLHGGSIRAKSMGRGHGATFTIALPVLPINWSDTVVQHDDRREPQATSVQSSNGDACMKISGVKVLVVDDEPDGRNLIKRLLEDCEATVTTAGSATEALDLFKSVAPDVLVSDVGMPGEDGYSLIRRIRKLGPEHRSNVPAIALTAYARSEDRTRSVLAGFQMHISKPVEPSELIAMIASLAGRAPQAS
ncbi:MAG TPA: PAS domain S-box protein [Tepidisphaeraceae bacterium]|jgi:PAS domain S-box-containing protein|nr:PAS domain S-box protein [Tepidisphaeraceae bacterium]